MRKQLFFGLLFFALYSCSPDSSNSRPTSAEGVIVVNEGAFGNTNSSVSFYNPANRNVSNDLFRLTNSAGFGGTVQSAHFEVQRCYVAVQTSSYKDKIVVAEAGNMKFVTEIPDMIIPRYMAAVGNKLFVSNWGNYDQSFNSPNSFVAIVDLSTNKITKKILTGSRPEGIFAIGNTIYIANQAANTITVLDAVSESIKSTLEMPKSPSHFVIDKENKLWVLCEGGNLVRINPSNNQIERNISLMAKSPSGNLALNANRDSIFFRTTEPWPSQNRAIWKISIQTTTDNAQRIIQKESMLSLGVDPFSNLLYIGIGTYSANGTVVRFNSGGKEIDNFAVGIAPNGFIFR